MAISFFLHGLMLWMAWGLFSIFQVIVNRYSKGCMHGVYMWLHRIFGTLLMVLTFIFAIWAWRKMKWKFLSNVHTYFVFPVLFMVFFVAVGGVFTRSMMRRCKWRTKTALSIKRVHMTFAYFIVICGACAVAAGLYEYTGKFGGLPIAHTLFFILTFVVLEAIHRMKLRREAPFEVNPVKSGNDT